MEFSFKARGNSKISSKHRSTIEITRQKAISKSGDCIIATSAEVGASGLPQWLKDHLRAGGRIKVKVEVGSFSDEFECTGHGDMTFEDKDDVVFRKSSFICGRTVGICCNKSASDLSRALVEELKKDNVIVEITISVAKSQLNIGQTI